MPIPMENGDQLLTSTEAREFIGQALGREKVSHDTLLGYVTKGLLHPRKSGVGRAKYYLLSELQALVKIRVPIDAPRLTMPLMVAHFDSYVRDVLHLEPKSQFLDEPAWITAPEEIAELLQLAPGTQVVHRRLLQGVIDEQLIPWRLSHNYYHPALVDQAMLEESRKSSQFDTMLAVRDRYGLTVREVIIRISARMPTIQEVDLLQMMVGRPVLEVHRVNYTAGRQQIVMVQHLVFRADLCELEVEHLTDLWEK